MAWSMKVDLLESCSCALICPCTMGPAKPDQEWCSGVFGLQVTQGESDGVDLTGAKLFLHFELPGDFMGGIDKAKLYLDTSLADDQRRELEAIFRGEKGGVWGGMKEAIKEWLPSKVTKVEFTDGESPGGTVEGVGELRLQPVKGEDGTPSKLSGAPVLGAFGIASGDLAFGTGTKFADPDMRSWESLGEGFITTVEWSG